MILNISHRLRLEALGCLLQAFYVPVAFVAIDLVTGKDWMSDVLGILVGHL